MTSLAPRSSALSSLRARHAAFGAVALGRPHVADACVPALLPAEMAFNGSAASSDRWVFPNLWCARPALALRTGSAPKSA